MIRLGLVGAADPRHRWFLAAGQRRRAGVRIIGLSEPDPALREQLAGLYDVPSWPDHRTLLEAGAPTMLAVAQPDAGPVVLDALRHGVDVLVAPPVCQTLDELDSIAELAASRGRRVTAAHTLRAHAAARTARELVDNGQLGRAELVSLIVGNGCDEERLRPAIADALDLFIWLTGSRSGTITAITEGHPTLADDPPEFRAEFGELILIATGADGADGQDAVFEVRRRSDVADNVQLMQVAGRTGAVEWDVGTGLLRAAINGRDPVTVSCGPFQNAPEWVLSNLVRRSAPVISTEHSLATTRVLLSAEESRRRNGGALDWRL